MGCNLNLKTRYGMVEHTSDKYPPRTFSNVKDSDGTVRLACYWNSPGELLTQKAIEQYHKPHFDIHVDSAAELFVARSCQQELLDWLAQNKIKTLNVAGNSERTAPGIYSAVLTFLLGVFSEIRQHD